MEGRTGTRKIQTSGSGSYYVTLPRVWVERNKIKKGDTIDIVCNGVDLHLIPPEKDVRKDLEKSLNLKNFSDFSLLERAIVNCYVQGYDVINIISEKTIPRERKDLIKNVVLPKLMGTGISEESSNILKIRVLIDPTKFPVNDIMKRIFNLVYSMHKDAIRSLEEIDNELAEDVIGRIGEVDKLYRLMLRQLMIPTYCKVSTEMMCTSRRECFTGAIAARDISRMAFYAVDIASQVKELKKGVIDKEIMGSLLKLSNLGMEMQEKAIEAFFNNDFRSANDIIEEIDPVRDLDYSIVEKISKGVADPKTSTALTIISRDIRRIASYAVAIADDTQTKSIFE
ncbi:MAG: phosphate uptake regulator PhoU [Halobacteriota archaeon]|nr:phosphate uptake regulator PhoU [Halobacteriota archaeon]